MSWVGIVPRGTGTGDSEHAALVLSHSERAALIEACTHLAGGRAVASLELGELRLSDCVELSERAVSLGASIVIGTAAGGMATGTDLARWAVALHRERTSGRAIRCSGQAGLIGVHTVEWIVSTTLIDRVAGVDRAVVALAARVDTGSFVRPVYDAGDLVLRGAPHADGLFQPLEREIPAQCCEDHPPRSPSTHTGGTVLSPVHTGGSRRWPILRDEWEGR